MVHKISNGASRNLVISGISASITEQRLRDDLEHIHGLVPVYISFTNENIYLSLNSVRHAVFAKSCLASRATYRRTRIDWFPDECDQPLPKFPKPAKTERSRIQAPTQAQKSRSTNRFHMLMNTEGTEDGSDEGAVDDTTLTDLSSPHLSHASTWTPRNIWG